MSEMAKKARAALRNKARKMAGETTGKVDSSSFTPGAPLNADAKTGMRPVSKRAFKKGGKVHGKVAKKRADRVQRKAGGKVESMEAKAETNAKMNRNLKEANELRAGKKHVGGMKKGGRANKAIGGAAADILGILSPVVMLANAFKDDGKERKRGGRAKKQGGGEAGAGAAGSLKDKIRDFLKTLNAGEAAKQEAGLADVGKGKTDGLSDADRAAMDALVEKTKEYDAGPSPRRDERFYDAGPSSRKSGGRTKKRAKKMDGGMLQSIGAANAATAAPNTNLVPSSVLNIQPGGARGKFLKTGGRAKREEGGQTTAAAAKPATPAQAAAAQFMNRGQEMKAKMMAKRDARKAERQQDRRGPQNMPAQAQGQPAAAAMGARPAAAQAAAPVAAAAQTAAPVGTTTSRPADPQIGLPVPMGAAAKKGGRIKKFGGGSLGYAQGGPRNGMPQMPQQSRIPQQGQQGQQQRAMQGQQGQARSPQQPAPAPALTPQQPQIFPQVQPMPSPYPQFQPQTSPYQQQPMTSPYLQQQYPPMDPYQQQMLQQQMMQPTDMTQVNLPAPSPTTTTTSGGTNKSPGATTSGGYPPPPSPYPTDPSLGYMYNTGGRVAKRSGGCATGYAEGGETKRGKGKKGGKTDINITINSGQQPQDGGAGAPPMGGPGMMPPPPPPMAGPPGGMPPGGMPPGGMPPGMAPPPGAFRRGGRAKSYKDMDAGAGSGEGRLEKTAIARSKRGK